MKTTKFSLLISKSILLGALCSLSMMTQAETPAPRGKTVDEYIMSKVKAGSDDEKLLREALDFFKAGYSDDSGLFDQQNKIIDESIDFFNKYDLNHNGLLTNEENSFGVRLDAEKRKYDSFKDYDFNNDHMISQEEMKYAGWQKTEDIFVDLMSCDTDGDRVLDTSGSVESGNTTADKEAQCVYINKNPMPDISDAWLQIIAKTDADGDEKITEAELLHALGDHSRIPPYNKADLVVGPVIIISTLIPAPPADKQ